MKVLWSILFGSILLLGCSSKTSESKSDIATDATTSVDEQFSGGVPSSPEGFLTIVGNDIWVRDYPNTGKVIMKLNEGDECKVLDTGRFDVIRGNGNYWYRIEFNDKTGWVFGSQTNMPLGKWEPGMNGIPDNYLSPDYEQLSASDFDGLYSVFEEKIKETLPFVDFEDDYSLGPEMDRIHTLNRDYKDGDGGISRFSIVAACRDGSCNFISN